MGDFGMKRLQELHSYGEIQSPSNAIRRGMHCPLFGCTLLMQQLEKTAVLLLGTEECGFYSKEILKVVNREHYLEAPVYCYALEERDVIFGCEEPVLSLLQAIETREKPEAVYLVSTCVPELIGMDMEGLARRAREQMQAELFYVDADNFKQNSHIDGMSDMTAALAGKMKPFWGERQGVNLLGGRETGLRGTELGRFLERRHIPIRAVLPSETSLESLQEAPQAQLNLVLDATGCKLARRMEELGVPYVTFGRYASPERILQAYRAMEAALGLEPDPAWDQEAARTQAAWDVLRQAPEARKRVIYGNSPLISFDVCLMLHRLGFELLACFVVSYQDLERELFPAFQASGMNPYMALLTDFSRTEELCAALHPGLYLGRGYADRLEQLGVAWVSPEQEAPENGFALSRQVARAIAQACGGPEKGERDGRIPVSSHSQ